MGVPASLVRSSHPHSLKRTRSSIKKGSGVCPFSFESHGQAVWQRFSIRGSSLTAVACYRQKTRKVKALKLKLSPRDLGRDNTRARNGHDCFK